MISIAVKFIALFEYLSNSIDSWLIQSLALDPSFAYFTRTMIMLLIAMIITIVIWRITNRLFHRYIPRLTRHTKTLWDDALLSKGVLNALALVLPVMLLDHFAPKVFDHLTAVLPFIKGMTTIFIVFTVSYIVASLLNAIYDLLSANPNYRDKPIGSFTQLGKILTYSVAIILTISIIFDKSPIYLLSGIGAIAAVILLVFKDSILGFVASVQLSANNMVHVGDWVTVPKYNADGDVLEINLTSIKVQNFDKTITTIPTYAFVADSFKNWRGMEQSQGRRIKRAVNIQISSIRFCSPEMIESFQKIHLIKDYVTERQIEIATYNEKNNLDSSIFANGRKLTNIGVFQVYLEKYLVANPSINENMTIMVRQLAASPNGLPIELYAFSKIKEWKDYEKVMADLFDHILASASAFDLIIFENPSGSDVQSIS
ncbi:MAG: miniconductance mechanosensitive channel [Patiriisocius sp.]|jgi:miniconductance mechanosensitive channel